MFKVEQLPLWDVLETKAVDDAQRAKVRQLIEDAAAILDRVIETFPTYTLHNSTHAENVVQLMADLLGPRRADLTPLEDALLMLSAFYHDIGMVFREDERNRLTEEPEWKTFLDTKPDAYLAVKKAGEVPLDIAEWYCRWRHADRVYVYLNRLPDDLLKWGQTSIREELGELCRSHNLPAADLLKLLRTEFRGEADLRFCAVLLRLADILDFDRTRSPEVVYEHLGLSRRIDPRQDASDVEWRKHLCTEGFRFPERRPDGYQLGFLAGPDEPGVEHDVREFLRVIEEEMEQGRVLLATCSERWRNLPLPIGIDRSNIHGNGYRYGEYRFTLDQGQVMDLLMGENLYEEPYVFIRELIQNALDASRHRRFIERASGNPGFEPKPIQVRHWIDRDGYHWVRFDDHGMGMDEEIVRNHLLKVGSSYYRTAAFRAEVLRVREKAQEDFEPISRFGIGLLSCFIAGDRIEISTLRRAIGSGTAVPIRLSLNGLHGFFTLQTPQLPAQPMPAPNEEEPGYRSEPGTSIAVRLDPTKESGIFDSGALLERYVARPPVPVELNGIRIGDDPAVLLDQPWCEPTTYTLSRRDMKAIGKLTASELHEPLRVELLPIDLTKHSPTSALKGQLLVAILQKNSDLESALKESELQRNLFYDEDKRCLRLSISSTSHVKPIPKRLRMGVSFGRMELPLRKEVQETVYGFHATDLAWLSHNGVAVPTSDTVAIELGDWSTGIVALADAQRPELSVSREALLGLPWRVYSILGLALYYGLSAAGADLRTETWDIFGGLMSLRKPLLLRDLLDDELLRLDGPWSNLPIIRTRKGLKSFKEIRNSTGNRPVEIFDVVPPVEEEGYPSLCAATLIQLGFKASVELRKGSRSAGKVRVFVSREDPEPITESHKLFPPLTFLPIRNARQLRSISVPLVNLSHPFVTWLLAAAPEIARRYPGLFERIKLDLTGDWSFYPSGLLEGLNAALDRLRELHPSVRPPKDLVLTEDDILE